MLDNSRILLTGGTGSFGRKFVEMTLSRYKPEKIVVYSRDEMKQWELAQLHEGDDRIGFEIGDVRDCQHLTRVMQGIDVVIHAAATKIVPTAEYNPAECVKTNINGALNVIEASINAGVKDVVALSTDKASAPINLYGATKLASDKLFVAANANRGQHETKFSVVRYGNVMGSRGSVIPFFLKQATKGEITITDERMTRFMITLEQGVELVWHALNDMVGGEIYVKKIPSMNIVDIARAVSKTAALKNIGIRAGEKLHEQMIGREDAPMTYSYDGYYKILPMINSWHKDPKRIKDGVPVAEGFFYSSETNTEWMTDNELSDWIEREFTGTKR